jgi:molecular chaperone GrpE
MKDKGKHNLDEKNKINDQGKDHEKNNTEDLNNDISSKIKEEIKGNVHNKELLEKIEKLSKLEKNELIKEYLNLSKEIETLKDKEKKMEFEANDNLDKYKRSLADLENYRKRVLIEKQDLLKYANFNILNDLLTVLDDFQRAFDSARKDEKMDLKHFVDGMEMIEKQFIDLLFKKYAIIKYGEKGEIFDCKIHSAIMAEDGDYKDEVILEVFRKGYMLHDRVVRPAEVKIGRPKQVANEESNENKEDPDSN